MDRLKEIEDNANKNSKAITVVINRKTSLIKSKNNPQLLFTDRIGRDPQFNAKQAEL